MKNPQWLLEAVNVLISNPKEGVNSKYLKYREWIHQHCHCYCGKPLSEQQGWLHHHQNSGGKEHCKDNLLTRFCAECHSRIHLSDISKTSLYARYGLTDEKIEKDMAKMLKEFIGEEVFTRVVLNAIGILFSSIEEIKGGI